jgi:aminodeoxyfutalosine deaminase
MKRFSAQYIITNSGAILKRAVITTDDDGTILNVEDTRGNLKEKHSVEFYNGIIVPGFVNCHCHLELSHLNGSINSGGRLDTFIEQVRSSRESTPDEISKAISSANTEMFDAGISLCADICNTSYSFNIKKKSRIEYINLLEVFGIDREKAEKRMDEISKVALTAIESGLRYQFVPHSAYSMSLSLLRLLREKTLYNNVTSIHFMETEGEKTFLKDHNGPLLSSYKRSGLNTDNLETVKSHADAILNEITLSGNLILVHNTFTDRETIKIIRERKNLFWCLCPNSNIYIENEVPPLNLLLEEGCEIVIGTDSLASNNRLSIFDEMKTLQFHFPSVSIEDLVRWGTINGARALGEENRFGKIEAGRKPGLVLLQDVDLINMKLLADSSVTRLI